MEILRHCHTWDFDLVVRRVFKYQPDDIGIPSIVRDVTDPVGSLIEALDEPFTMMEKEERHTQTLRKVVGQHRWKEMEFKARFWHHERVEDERRALFDFLERHTGSDLRRNLYIESRPIYLISGREVMIDPIFRYKESDGHDQAQPRVERVETRLPGELIYAIDYRKIHIRSLRGSKGIHLSKRKTYALSDTGEQPEIILEAA